MDINAIKRLILFLKKNQVTNFSCQEFKVAFTRDGFEKADDLVSPGLTKSSEADDLDALTYWSADNVADQLMIGKTD